jgi:RNA polymerase sigma-70 factor (ECF subfamily)
MQLMGNVTPSGFAHPTGGPADETSMDLLARARVGDAEALNQLAARYLPQMRRWASGRLPQWARDLAETDDLVQDSLFQTFRRLTTIDVEHEGALQAYLRQAVMNRIRDHLRRAGRRPAAVALATDHPAAETSPLEAAIGAEALERYERALAALRPDDQAAIIGRIELDYSNEELAVALNRPSANAARMAVERALVRLADEMRRNA